MHCMMVAYRPSRVPLDHIASELALEQDGADVVDLLRSVGGRCDKGELDTKGSFPVRITSGENSTSWIGAVKD